AVTRVQNREGQTLWHAAPYACADCAAASWAAERPPELSRRAPEQIVSPQTAYQMISMLKGVVERGTAHALNDLDLALAAKTGTSNDTRDVWFVGVTPDLVVGCFVGFDQPRSLGDKVSGANTALPIVRDFLLEAVAQGTGRDFAVPPDLEYARVDLKTGEPSASKRNSVLEVFKRGNAPPPPPPRQAARRTPTDGLAPNFAGVY
ncbi:MAG: penicillin-binding transpeptidase domain-containing protein, partial [Hyphomicrobiales bacterium]|nr:penicillin-binding transpeptidase domain-containing protein [Hyphomicrobiales bacterium]